MTLVWVLASILGGCVADVDSIGGAEQPPPNADPQAGCALECHGTDSNNAPPMGVSGTTATTAVGIGAHRQHVALASSWHRQVQCADCHVVPAEVGSLGHIDGDNKAEVTFGTIAGAAATWTEATATCTAHCHGSSVIGGAKSTPIWTQVDGTQSTCGSCHGAPPPPPHPAATATNCSTCHPTMEAGSLTFRDPTRHIDGVVDVVSGANGDCTSCHGSPTSSAPPKDLAGNTANTVPGVGAHAAHLAPSTWHNAITCVNCHVVPTAVDSPGHRDGDNIAEITFDRLNPAGVYTRANATCSSQYCHGNGRGNTGTKSWITPGAIPCGGCHALDGTGMSGDHRKHIIGEGMKCSQCHAEVVDAARKIINAALHVDGVHEVKMANGTFNAATRACSNTGCHGTETW